MVIGGAYSVDKEERIFNSLPWFSSEQPDQKIKNNVLKNLNKVNWNVDLVFSHTVPIDYEPVWAFIPGMDQDLVDKSTEEWLQEIYDKTEFNRWYSGHYHLDTEIGKVKIMFEGFEEI